MKRILILGVGFVLAALATVFYFFKSEKTFFKETSLYQAIPVSVPFFAEVNSLKSLPFDGPVVKRWEDVNGISGLNYWISGLDSTISENSDIQNALRSTRFVLAFGLMGDNELVPLLIHEAGSSGRQKSITTLVKTLFPEPGFQYSEIDYAGLKIVSGNTPDNRKSIHYCFASGLLIASPNLVLVQQSVLQLNDPGIISNSSFKKITETFSSEPDLAWFVNHKLFPEVLLGYMNSGSLNESNEFGENVKRNHYRNVRDFKNYGSWSQLETHFGAHEIFLEGLTIANDTTNDFLAVFDKQEPQRIDAGEILPANISFYTSFSFSNKTLFFQNLENYFAHGGSFYKREDEIRRYEKGLKVDFRKTFQQMVKSEVLAATAEITGKGEKTNYFIFDVGQQSKAENLLDSVLNNYARNKNVPFDDLKSRFVVNEQNTFDLISFPYPSFPGIWLGKPFYFVRADFAVFYKNYLVFCNTREGLQTYITEMENGNLLAKQYVFTRTMGQLEKKANISTYFNPEKGAGIFGELFHPKPARQLEKKKDAVKRIQGIGWNVSAAKTGFTNKISLVFDDGKSEGKINRHPDSSVKSGSPKAQNGGWTCNIGEPLIGKPVITVNHSDKNNHEILVQGKSGKLYQLSSDGKINWIFDLGEEIKSEIFQADSKANGELQYLFSTKRKLFLLDREGKMVDGFPVEFPTMATAGVNVFDYDNNRQYRYFVPCRDKKIYVYDNAGKIVEGWDFPGTQSEVSTPVQHFRIKGKDYIVFKDEQNIYIQNRRGEDITRPNIKFENSANPLILNPVNPLVLLATDDRGKIHVIAFDGETGTIDIGKFDDDHFFTAADLNGDKLIEFVFIDGKRLKVYDEKGTELFTQKFSGNIKYRPNIYDFGAGEKRIGITDSRAEKIYLFDLKGQSHPGFPLSGATEFSIGKIDSDSKNLVLLVGSSRGSLIKYDLD
jgi:hypothetical protein